MYYTFIHIRILYIYNKIKSINTNVKHTEAPVI